MCGGLCGSQSTGPGERSVLLLELGDVTLELLEEGQELLTMRRDHLGGYYQGLLGLLQRRHVEQPTG